MRDHLLSNYFEQGFCVWESFLSEEEVGKGLLPHQSGLNYSEKERKALFVTYTTVEYGDQGELYYRGIDSLRKYYDQKNAF